MISTITPEQIQAIAHLYAGGMPGTKISTKLGIARSIVYRQIHRAGVEVRPLHVAMRTISICHDTFSVPSPEVAYWVGFLLADGCVIGSHVIMGLSAIDKPHLQKFLDFVQADYKITEHSPVAWGKAYPSCRVAITSRQISEDLRGYGVHSRKTGREYACDLFKYDHNFWRGVVDGDGWLCPQSDTPKSIDTLGVCGTRELCQQFLDFCSVYISTELKVLKHSSIYKIQFAGQNARTVASVLYGQAPSVYLDRKLAKARVLMRLGCPL